MPFVSVEIHGGAAVKGGKILCMMQTSVKNLVERRQITVDLRADVANEIDPSVKDEQRLFFVADRGEGGDAPDR